MVRSGILHRNPVEHGRVLEPEHWQWSSHRHYACDEPGIVLGNQMRPAKPKIRKIA